jgi:hypothetical protein
VSLAWISPAVFPTELFPFTDHAKDAIKGHADSAGSTLQPQVNTLDRSLFSFIPDHIVLPQSQKSTTQKVGDAVSSNSNENDQSLLDKAKNAVGLGETKH